MVTASQELKNAFNSNDRELYGKVNINFSDLTIDPSIAVTTTENFPQYLIDQITNGRTSPLRKWAGMDGDGGSTINNWVDSNGNNMTDSNANNMVVASARVLTDMSGDYYMMPGTETDALATQVGLWSSTVCDALGVCDVTYNITGSKRNLTQVLIYGDDKRLEYPVDLTVKFYEDTTLLQTETITGNTLNEVNIQLSPLVANVTKLVINITKWSTPLATVKITSTLTSLNREFLGSEISNFNILEESEINNNATIPTGNISYGRANVSLINVNRQFDTNNSASPLYNNLKPNSKVDIWIGAKTTSGIEYAKMFSGWTEGFDAPDNSMTVSTTGYDRLKRLELTPMSPQPVIVNQTVAYIIKLILNNADIADESIDIDPRLDTTDYLIPYYFIAGETHLAELRRLSAAIAGSVFTRDDTIVFDALGERTDFMITTELTPSIYSNKTNRPLYDSIYNKVQVPYKSYESQTSISQYKSATALDPIPSGISVQNFFFKEKACFNHALIFTPPAGITITQINYYSDRAVAIFNNTNSSTTNIDLEITGQYYGSTNNKAVSVLDQTSIDDYGEFAFQLDESDLLQTSVVADTIANLLLSLYKDPFRDATIQLSNAGSPVVSLQDNITLTDKYVTDTFNIVSKEVQFDGGINMTLKCKKSVLVLNNWVDSSGNNMTDSSGNNMVVLGIRSN